MKNAKQLNAMTDNELREQLEDTRKELFNLRQQQVSGHLENPLQIRAVRRSIARIKTMMNQAVNVERG